MENIFRTDLGDDERKPNRADKEWSHGRKDEHHDATSEDDIDILIRSNGTIKVEYRSPTSQARHIEINQ